MPIVRVARHRSCLLAFVTALVVAGCGSSDNVPPASTPTPASTRTATVPPTATSVPATATAEATRSATATATAPATETSTEAPTATVTPTEATTPTEVPVLPTPTIHTDPGTESWRPIPPEQAAERCGLDPELLRAANPLVGRPFVVVRYGQLCHEFYPEGDFTTDPTEEIFSTTKSLGALVTGVASYQTRDLPRSGRKTGPIHDDDRVDHWLDTFSFNPDAQIAHVLGMVAWNADLSYGAKEHLYDIVGSREINRLTDVINTAVLQDTDRLGENIDVFSKRFLFEPLGMNDSRWFDGDPNKLFGLGWHSTVRDMARVGLLLLRDGVWSGERVLASDWVYKMTHPSFEDANTGYGYLTWLNSASNWTLGLGDGLHQGPLDVCAPLSLNTEYPHGISEAPGCNYDPPYMCGQPLDVGMWYFAGLGGQYIVGHRALDLVMTVKNFPAGPAALWAAVRPALVALDPRFAGDEEGFCAEYARGAYAPDLPD